MTLSTYVGFAGEVDPLELHTWVNEHLLDAPHARYEVCGPDHESEYSRNRIANEPGQGFSAWVITRHNNGDLISWWEPDDEMDASWEKYGGQAAWEESQAEDRERYAAYPSVHAYVDFDTAYGYHGPNNEDCNVLHATYIVRLLREFAEPRGLKLHWQNEYTGEWHEGAEGIEAFLGNGDAAQGWFKQAVVPLLKELGAQ